VSNNQSFGRAINQAEDWRRYDSLPPDVRRIYQLAPYEMWIRPASWSKDRLVAMILARRDQMLVKTYGSDHPQIGSRTPERRPARRRAR